MTEDEHLWACALEVERQHGKDAMAFVNDRRVDLAMAGDRAGVERWEAIAACLEKLESPSQPS